MKIALLLVAALASGCAGDDFAVEVGTAVDCLRACAQDTLWVVGPDGALIPVVPADYKQLVIHTDDGSVEVKGLER